MSDKCWKLLRAAGEAVIPWLRQEISFAGSPWGDPWLWDGAGSESKAVPGDCRRCLCWIFLGLWGAMNRALTTRATEISHKCDHLAAALGEMSSGFEFQGLESWRCHPLTKWLQLRY